MEKIAVLMSTFNGEKYLGEQIDSLLAQKDVEIFIYIRDDGSTDGTPQIICEYEDRYNNITFINRDGCINLGFNKSYFTLLRYALDNLTQIDFLAFCDQDDVWMEDKLCKAVNVIRDRLDKVGKDINTPFYYYSNKYWSDEKLNVLHEDNMEFCKDDYFDMFMLPPVYGCTSVFNRALCEMTLEPDFPNDLLYDVYMFRMACMTDGVIISDKNPHIYYRRHGKNASGDAMSFSPIKRVSSLIFKRTSFHGMQKYVKEISELHQNELAPEQKELSKLVCNYDSSISYKVKLLLWKRAYQRGLKTSIIWVGRVLLNAI